MAKILTKFPKAYIVDCFSGPGVYKKGQPGSSVIAAMAYLEHSRRSKFGQVEILCCEERDDRVERLRQELATLNAPRTLQTTLLPPGTFAQNLDLLERTTKSTNSPPTLWLIDPFNIKNVSMNDLQRCLLGPRNEVILTFFVDEMYRLAGKNQNLSPAMDRHFGGDAWCGALDIDGESSKKNRLTDIFVSSLQSFTGAYGRSFGVRAKNATSRYELIYATHSEAGLECWNSMTWRMDKIAGSRTSAALAEQQDLFGTVDTDRLEVQLLKNSGNEVHWSELTNQTLKIGFKETHLRQALTNMGERGEALRVAPIDSNTPWPAGCRVQFYSSKDYEVA